jgi:hypothetical protein
LAVVVLRVLEAVTLVATESTPLFLPLFRLVAVAVAVRVLYRVLLVETVVLVVALVQLTYNQFSEVTARRNRGLTAVTQTPVVGVL